MNFIELTRKAIKRPTAGRIFNQMKVYRFQEHTSSVYFAEMQRTDLTQRTRTFSCSMLNKNEFSQVNLTLESTNKAAQWTIRLFIGIFIEHCDFGQTITFQLNNVLISFVLQH